MSSRRNSFNLVMAHLLSLLTKPEQYKVDSAEPRSGLGVVPGPRAGGGSWLIHRHSQRVILIGMVGASRVERDDVIGISVRGAVRDRCYKIVGRVQNQPAALHR